jgi:nicotinate-nucleotide adenylyltransferase
MSIALYFGSFNPIHVGHLVIAESVLLESEIEKVWFVLSPQNPFKNSEGLLSEYQRYYLCQIATEDNPNFYISNIEFGLPKPSYTVDTLAYIQEKYPDKEFSLLIGGDNLEHFHKWKNAETIIKNHKIFAYKRPSASKSAYDNHPNVKFLEVPMMDISSTLIRQRIKAGQSIRYLVLDNVIDEIEKGHFYL